MFLGETITDSHEAINTVSKPKRGRKPKAAAEKRTVKLSIYLTPSLYANVKDLANLYGKSITDYIVSLIERDTEAKQEHLIFFREMRKEFTK